MQAQVSICEVSKDSARAARWRNSFQICFAKTHRMVRFNCILIDKQSVDDLKKEVRLQMSDQYFFDKVILITGASSGIGWATALALAPFRPRLVLAARREPLLRDLAALIQNQCQVIVLPLDVSDFDQVTKAVEQVLQQWGQIDFLINNAGIIANARFHEQSIDEIEKLLRVNYLGAVAMTHAVLPGMLKQNWGHIVNVSSIGGMTGFPYISAYCGSKFAMVGWTEALRREYYGTGVTFTSFCPGTVDTPMIAASLKNERFKKVTRQRTPEQVAQRIVKCCRNRTREAIYGEIPSFVMKAARFFPAIVDLFFFQVYRRVHPLARECREKND